MSGKNNVKLSLFVLVLVLFGSLAFGFIPADLSQGRVHKVNNYTATDDYTVTDDYTATDDIRVMPGDRFKDGYTATDDLRRPQGENLVIFPSWFGEDGYTATDDYAATDDLIDRIDSFVR